MEEGTLKIVAKAALEQGAPPEARHRLTLTVDATRTHDPLWPDVPATASYALLPEGTVEVMAYGGAASEADVATAVLGAAVEALAEIEIREALAKDDDLFEAHARFRSGQPVLARFYRAGDEIGPAVYVVDLDVFVELRVLAETWAKIKGQRITLAMDEEGIELEVPRDADTEEILTLPGAGMLDADETLSEEDTMPPAGDLHVIVIVYDESAASASSTVE